MDFLVLTTLKSLKFMWKSVVELLINQLFKLKISSIMDEESTLDKVDILKVDVEGHEFEVLKSFDFDKYQPALIITEDNFKDADKSVRSC